MITKFVPAKIRREVKIRQGMRCAICTTKLPSESLQIHHIKFKSEGGDHDKENLTALCPKCHEYLHKHPEHFVNFDFHKKRKRFCHYIN